MPSMAGAPPICLAMILCDAVHQDPASGKSFILGTFSTIFAETFPAKHPSLWVFIQLTNGHGEAPLEFKISQLVPEDLNPPPLFRGAIPCVFRDRQDVVDLFIKLDNLVLPKEGGYRLILEMQGTLIIERRLRAAHTPPGRVAR